MRYFALSIILCGILPLGGLLANTDYSTHSTLHIEAAAPSNARTFSVLDDILGGERVEPDMKEVEKHALGSEGNPVRCDMPTGERAYLNRLRCENNRTPRFEREGSDGFSPWGTIMDIYDVQCPRNKTAPKKFTIFMDMYHPNYQEERTVKGFTIVPAR